MKNKKEDSQKEKKIDDENVEQPNWYHYLIILVVILGVIFAISFTFEIYSQMKAPNTDLEAEEDDKYVYSYKRGNVTYNIELSAPRYEIEKFNFTNEFDRIELLNTNSFRFSFDEYNGSVNGDVSISAIKLRRILSDVYFFNFDSNSSFLDSDEISCANSTTNHRVVMFKPHSNESGLFEEENGCIVVRANQSNLMPFVIDNFVIDVTNQ